MYDTRLTGSQIIRLDSVDSTNNYAAKLLKAGNLQDGAVIMAYEQSEGRGQRGTHWLSKKGENLTFSLVLKPKHVSIDSQFIISKIAALSVSDTLELFGIQNQIKWPNDIITSKGKISGILIENSVYENKISHAIIGIGINVNQTSFIHDFKACSIVDFIGSTTELNDVLNTFLKMFDNWYFLLQAGREQYIHDCYLIRLLNFGKMAKYEYKGTAINALITGVNPQGMLMLKTHDNVEMVADLKELKLLT